MDWNRDIQVIKLEHEQQVVRGVVLEPDVVDAQDDMMTTDEIEKAAHGFMVEVQRGVGSIGVDHEAPADAVVVESFLAPIEFSEGDQTIRKGSWMLAVKIFDEELWESIKSGDRTAFSIHGRAERVPVGKDDRPSAAARGYGHEHRKWAADVLEKYPICPCGTKSKIADHRKPISQGGEWTIRNGQGLCQACHNKKTGKERRAGNDRRAA